MARRHVDNEPLVLSRGDIFKLLRYDVVVGPCNKFRPDLPYVPEKIVPASLYFFKLGKPQLQLQPAFGYFGSLCTKNFSQSPSSLRTFYSGTFCILLSVSPLHAHHQVHLFVEDLYIEELRNETHVRNSCNEASACFLLRVYFFRFLTTRILNIEVRNIFAIGFFFDCFT